MNIELVGILKWIFTICVTATSVVIIIIGTWCVINWFIWNILVQYSLRWLNLYAIFLHFIKYNKRFLKWAKKYEGKIEEGANDDE